MSSAPIGDPTRVATLLQQQGLLAPPPAADPQEDAPPDQFAPASHDGDGLIRPDELQARRSRMKSHDQQLPSPEDTIRGFEQFHREDATPADLKAIRQELKAAHKSLRNGGSPIDKNRVADALGDVNESLARLNDADRERKWGQVTGALGHEPSATFKGYFKASNTPVKEMAEVVRVAEDYADPASERRIHGNTVEALPRDRIWAAKMQVLDDAAKRPVRDGKPLEIDAEYYELSSPQVIDRLNQAAEGGANVRVLIDSGRLEYGPGGSRNASSLAGRLNTLARLQDGEAENKPAVTLFANQEILGSKSELMHRKLLRVGDEVVFGGMNANEGSGENVDFGMKIKGPAAGELVGTFREDVNASVGASNEQIFGNQLDDLRTRDDVRLDRRGVKDFIGALTPEVKGGVPERLAALEAKGQDIHQLIEIPDQRSGAERRKDVAGYLDGRNEDHGGAVKLTEKGRTLLADELERRAELTRAPENQARLRDISTPSAEGAKGPDTLAIANDPIERQAAVLNAIDSADRFVKISAFVVTDDTARALIEKRDTMAAQGKPFEAQVMLDPGLYAHGDTPNTKAFKMLEDAGVEVRWNLLDRSEPGHDRKNHSKAIITDKLMLAGSTNFSAKGLRNNWEMSEVTWFGDDAASQQAQKQVVADFDRTWQKETLDINTRSLADARYADAGTDNLANSKDRYRNALIRTVLNKIEDYERQAGTAIQAESTNGDVAARVQAQRQDGVAQGYALLNAVGPDRLAEIRATRPAYRELQQLADRGLA